mgnify:FL=1
MSSMHRGEEKEAMQVDWSHFTLADFLELRWRLLNDWQAVLPGGEYFGQVRIGDVCYDIQIEWLTEDEPDTGDASGDKAAVSPEQDDDTEEADIDDLEDWNELGDSVNGMELMVTMSPFFPHDEDEPEPPYDELVPGMPYDTQHGASLIDSRRHFLQLTYESFVELAERSILGIIARFPRLQAAAMQQTGFWDRHDAILCKLRDRDEEGR